MDLDDLVEIKGIDLSYKTLGDDGLDVPIEVVRTSDALEELDLRGNRLTLADGKMAEAIARSRTLQVLDLGDNQIADEGAKRLAGAIKENETLQEIHLYDNKIRDEGAKSFADALAVNKSLREIDLGWNEIGDEGAQSLAASFETSRTLRTVHLAHNNITNQGAQKLANALEKNYTISLLPFDNNPISCLVRKKIDAIFDDEFRQSLAAKDQELEAKEEEIARRDEEIARKNKEIATLKTEHSASLKAIESLKKSIKAPLEQPEMIANAVDLTRGDPEPSKKRPRTAGGS